MMRSHLSPDEIAQWVSGDRAPEYERHLVECPHCAAEVAQLEKTLSLFRESGERWSDHWFSAMPVAPAPRWLPVRLAAVAAVICAVLVLVLWRPSTAPHINAAAVAETPFVEMPYVAPLAPYERFEVVRMNVSVAALEGAGLEVHARDTGAMVLADLLLGQDGRAHAVRLVSREEISKGR